MKKIHKCVIYLVKIDGDDDTARIEYSLILDIRNPSFITHLEIIFETT